MLSSNQWKEDCFAGITAAFMAGTISVNEAGRCRISVKKTIDSEQMGVDTVRRTGGKCPTKREYLNHQFDKLVEVFARLNCGIDGG